MTGIIDIRLLDLALAIVIVLLPVLVFLYFRVKVIGDVFISLVRMVLQLSMVALYLEWIFEQNSAWINLAWVFVMVLVSVFTTIRRVGLKIRYFVIPFLLSGIGSIVIVDSFFLGYVIKLEYLFDARYFVPITGMVLGNSINHNVVGLGAYFDGLRDKSSLYYFLLTNTGSQKRAIRPYISDAIRKGLNPLIATMSVIGLISLPGMMTGQILGGSAPIIAIKYQIMIMLAIFTGCTINLALSILISNTFVFDGYGRFKDKVVVRR
jgi:putative ABC transport system permease protein